MNTTTEYHSLQCRLDEILAKHDSSQALLSKDVHDLIGELNLHQTKLRKTNENLVTTLQELQISHNKYADSYHFAPIAHLILNGDGLIIDANQSSLDLFGIEKKSLLNTCFSLNIAPEFQLAFSQLLQQANNDKQHHSLDLKLIRWSGQTFDALLDFTAIPSTNENSQPFLICITDITNRKLAERSLQTQRIKLSTIDRMRSINEQIYSFTRSHTHSLAVMSNYISGCIRRLESYKPHAKELIDVLGVLKKVSRESAALSDIILQKQCLTSKSVLRYEIADINTIISDILPHIGFKSFKTPVTIRYVKKDDLPPVKVDVLHIQHVILNLARNAIEAMTDSKTPQPRLLIEARLETAGEIEISVFDNGPGFESSDLPSLFESNFTTKAYALGLGLTTSRAIIEKHGGQLNGELNPSGGATFRFTLPCLSFTKNVDT